MACLQNFEKGKENACSRNACCPVLFFLPKCTIKELKKGISYSKPLYDWKNLPHFFHNLAQSGKSFWLLLQGILKEYHCTADLLLNWFGMRCMTTEIFCFYLQNRLIQTSQTGGQRYCDTSPFIISRLLLSNSKL